MWEFLSERMKLFESVICDAHDSYTYAQMIRLAERHGEKLMSRFPAFSKCAVLCDSGINTALALLSCWYADIVPIPMSKHYGERHCRSILELTAPDCIIADSPSDFESLQYRIDISEFKDSYKEIDSERDLQGVALIMCTSGTTGKPKGAVITIDGLKKNVLAISKYFSISDKDTILIARPLYHCAVLTGEFLISLYFGLDIHFYNKKYSPISIIELCNKNDITVLCGTPTLFKQISLLNKRAQKELPVKIIALSGECLSKKIAGDIRCAFKQASIYHVYGLTEASPRVTFLPPEKFDVMPESVGLPLIDTKIKIVDPESLFELPSHAHGLVMVSSPSLLKCYYKASDETMYEEALDKSKASQVLINGWLNTGDIGYLDDEGYLYILSRSDDMIIKAGMNIYPKEIEEAIGSIPEISGIVAYGSKSEMGQEICVNIVLNDGYDDIDTKQLMVLFSKVLPGYQLPSRINIVASLERNSSGKIIRPGN